MKETIKKVLEMYADRQINLASEVAREELAEAIYREVGNFLQWWGKKPDIRYEDRDIFPDDPHDHDDNGFTKNKEGKRFKMPDNYGVDQGGAYER